MNPVILVVAMSFSTVLEMQLAGREADPGLESYTDLSSDLGDQPIRIKYGIRGSGINNRVASSGTCGFELMNDSPQGKYSFRHTNLLSGFALGIGVRVRIESTVAQGTGSGYLIAAAGGFPAAARSVIVDTGTGTLLKDDLIAFAGISGKYFVTSTAGTDPVTQILFTPGLFGSVADNAAITVLGRNFTRFRGRLDSARPVAGVFERRTVRCVAVDWMDDAARAKLEQVPAQLSKRADETFRTLVDAVPFAPDAIEQDTSPDTYPYTLDSAKDEATAILSEFQKLALSELAFIYQKANGTVVFESRIRRSKQGPTIDTFTDIATLSGLRHGAARDDAISKVQLITHPRRVDTVDTTVLFKLANPFLVGASTTATILGPYRDPTQESSRVGGTDMRTPVATTDYLANSQSDGSGTNLTPKVSLVVSFGGNGARIEITNSGTEPAYMTLLQLRGRGIYDFQNVVSEAADATAQINIGTTDTTDMPYQDDPVLAEEAALWLLSLYKDFDNLVESATIFVPRSDTALADRVLSREISDRIEIVEQMTGFVGGAATDVFFINNIDLTIDDRDNLSITWGLAPVNRQDFWLLEVIGQSELDSTTVLGFGLVTGHADEPHVDIHGDAAHTDTAHVDTHTDEHGDTAHGDTSHTDVAHGDTAHSDTAHQDDHDDTEHGDTSHTDTHDDVAAVNTHTDVAHTDTLHRDTHSDFDDDI